MRHTELRARLEQTLGPAYAQIWCDTQVIAALNGRTVTEALAAGVEPKAVWRAVVETRDLPASER